MEDPKTTRTAAVPTGDPDENWAGELEAMMQFAEGGIVSKTLVDRPKLANISLFMMATGQKMSSHAASRPATIQVLGGEGHDPDRRHRRTRANAAPSSTCRPDSLTRWSPPTTWSSCSICWAERRAGES